MRFQKTAILVMLLGIFLCCSGCETTKAIVSVGPAMVEDVRGGFKSTRESLTKADEWFKENLW